VRALEFVETGMPLRVAERPMPAPRPGEVVLKVAYCGICGSDIHSTEPSASQVPAGTVLGHEFSGEVALSTVPEWQPGMRAIAVPLLPCEDCRPDGACRDGLGILCPRTRIIGLAAAAPGAYAEYVTVPARQLLAVPDEVPLDAAALAEPLAVGAHAVRLAGSLEGQNVLIIGAGPIGLATAAFAAHAGARHVIVSEIDPIRRERAAQLGATALIDPAAGPVADTFAAMTGHPPGTIFECVGVPGMLRQSIDLAGIRGQIVVVGVCRHDDTILPRAAIRKELTLRFVLGYTDEDFRLSLDLLASPAFDASAMITARVSFDELPAVFESLRHPNPHGKVLLAPTRLNDITNIKEI